MSAEQFLGTSVVVGEPGDGSSRKSVHTTSKPAPGILPNVINHLGANTMLQTSTLAQQCHYALVHCAPHNIPSPFQSPHRELDNATVLKSTPVSKLLSSIQPHIHCVPLSRYLCGVIHLLSQFWGCSSVPSWQSSSPSHSQLWDTQRPLPHWNWLAEQFA